MTATVNFSRIRGDTYPIEVTVTDTDGSPLNVTGATFLLTVDPEESPANATANEFQSTGTIVSAANGTVEFPITTTNADLVGTYYYDVQMILSTVKYTIMRGSITFTQDITKD